ncbi:MAG: DUF4259 domain-containing protein [Verrucomicrobiales bacterium]
MGAWDHTSFGNDEACDWAYELEDCADLSFVEQTLDKVVNNAEYLETFEAAEAIAAAETVARLQGRHGIQNAYSETVDQWVEAHPIIPPPALIAKAHAALDRILDGNSELFDLWEESDSFEEWKGAMIDLKERIG